MVYFSPCGGTGSGFTSAIMDELSKINDGKTTRVSFQLSPSQNLMSSIVEPYNFVLSHEMIRERFALNIVNTNENIAQML